MIKYIRLAELKDKDMIVELLNKVTLHLHGMGINQWTYPWNADEIVEDIAKGQLYILIVDNSIVGTFSIKNTVSVNADIIKPNHNYLYRIAISPEWQGKKLGADIIEYSIDYSKNTGKSLYLDCWAGNKKLREFYSDAGFEFIGDFPEEDYFISVFKWQ